MPVTPNRTSLPRDVLAVDRAGDDVRRGDEAGGVVVAKPNPEMAVGLAADQDVPDSDRLDAVRAGADRIRGSPHADAQRLQAERWERRVGDRGEQRDSANHAVRYVRAQQGTARRGSVDLFQARQRRRKMPQIRQRITLQLEHRRRARRGFLAALVDPRNAEHHRQPLDRGCKRIVVAQQAL